MKMHWHTRNLLLSEIERLEERQEQYRNPRFTRGDVAQRLEWEKKTIADLKAILADAIVERSVIALQALNK